MRNCTDLFLQPMLSMMAGFQLISHLQNKYLLLKAELKEIGYSHLQKRLRRVVVSNYMAMFQWVLLPTPDTPLGRV